MLDMRKLGRTDLAVSSICLGTMTFGQQNTEAEGHAQLDLAVDRGINFIDTAEMYAIPPRAETQGATERIIGTWFAARGNRDKIVLATKVSGRSGAAWMRPDGKGARLDKANIAYAVEQSLKRLRTDYIDLYQVHWPDRVIGLFGEGGTTFRDLGRPDDGIPIEETLAALDELVTAGKVRHIGLSNETAWGVSRFLHLSETGRGPRVVSIQNAYSLLSRTFEMGLAEIALREQVGLLAYSPLAQGYLTGKYQHGARPPGARSTLFDRGQRYEKPGAEAAIDAYLGLARDLGVDPAHLALAYVTSRRFVTSNIIGATTIPSSNKTSARSTSRSRRRSRIASTRSIRSTKIPRRESTTSSASKKHWLDDAPLARPVGGTKKVPPTSRRSSTRRHCASLRAFP